jgi:CheY-like chemotaxis protein
MARVLLVCDEPEIAAALRLLVESNHTVEYARSAQEVFHRIASNERFDVIFSDVELEDMPGVTMKTRLARIAPEMSNRIVFLTGSRGWKSATL